MDLTSSSPSKRQEDTDQTGPDATESISNSLGLSGVDLIAMVVSDSGLAAAEPVWWNSSPLGCILMGFQPRGGWQIMQRAVQWGADSWANSFGVDCAVPVMYTYFACTIRNRLEVLDSDNFDSPMAGAAAGATWRERPGKFAVKRPTKLIDGSRGGQAFVCDLLVPEGDKHYSIRDQSHVQLVSVLLAGAGLAHDDVVDRWETFRDRMLRDDFELGDRLGDVFGRLNLLLCVLAVSCVVMDAMVLVAVWGGRNPFGEGIPYVTKIMALATWAVGAIGLFKEGGNPRVRLTQGKVRPHVQERLDELRAQARVGPRPCPVADSGTRVLADDEIQPVAATTTIAPIGTEKTEGAPSVRVRVQEVPQPVSVDPTLSSPVAAAGGNDAEKAKETGNFLAAVVPTVATTIVQTKALPGPFDPANPLVTVSFGSLHGSVYTPDSGSCVLSLAVVEKLCGLDVRLVRTWWWTAGIVSYGVMLLVAIALQISATRVPSFYADLIGLAWLLATSVLRGQGVSGSEEWMIPKWKRRRGTANGAVLLGQFGSRDATAEAA